MTDTVQIRAARIRTLNDQLRTNILTGTHTANAHVNFTQGVFAQGAAFVNAALAAVSTFDDFSDENDPYAEHDFGSVTVAGMEIFFKIEYYDPDLRFHSDDPTNAEFTVRILTIMLASDY